MSNPLALVVDDEPDIRELLEITLGRMDIDTRAAADLKGAHELLAQHQFDLCLTDMRLPDGSGIELVERIVRASPRLPVAVITAHGNMELAVQALKAGAFDFVSKPVDLAMLRKLVDSALKTSPGRPKRDRRTRHSLIGESQPMRQARSLIAKLAQSQAPVYISGESGTGKELAARLIHRQGPRVDGPFVAVNCGAIPQELMESEFFGHRKGSFTGAVADKQGLFQAADGGSLFLDEVADLPIPMQVKLLRAIQERTVRPVGAQHEVAVDVRIISATHQDLAELADNGRFRKDLYYRINVIELPMPALRERSADIPMLVEHVLSKIAAGVGTAKPRITGPALDRLCGHAFPGNVRELENILERAITLADGDEICAEDLQLTGPAPPPRSPDEDVTRPPDMPLEDYLGEIERQTIVQALEETRWNRTAAAKKLGISFRALRYRLSKLRLE